MSFRNELLPHYEAHCSYSAYRYARLNFNTKKMLATREGGDPDRGLYYPLPRCVREREATQIRSPGAPAQIRSPGTGAQRCAKRVAAARLPRRVLPLRRSLLFCGSNQLHNMRSERLHQRPVAAIFHLANVATLKERNKPAQ